MTSMDAESVATILCTAKQTRFNIATPSYREVCHNTSCSRTPKQDKLTARPPAYSSGQLDIEGLNITVKSTPKESGATEAGSSSSAVAKKKTPKATKGEGIEILSNAKLRLKAGQRYALIGRNGTGKSTLLRAIAEKLIPGVPEETRVVLLQQTSGGDLEVEADNKDLPAASGGNGQQQGGLNVLEEVIERATAKQQVQKDINRKLKTVSFSPFSSLVNAPLLTLSQTLRRKQSSREPLRARTRSVLSRACASSSMSASSRSCSSRTKTPGSAVAPEVCRRGRHSRKWRRRSRTFRRHSKPAPQAG